MGLRSLLAAWGSALPPRVLRPQAGAGGSTEAVWALALTAVVGLILATDLAAPDRIGAGALVVLPVLAAGWTVGVRGLVVVVVAAAALEVAGVAIGQLSPLMVAGRLVTIALVAAVGRGAAVSFSEVRRARQREVGVLMRSSQLLGRSLDQHGVAAEAVRVAAGTLVTAGRRGIRRAVLLRVVGDRAVVMASYGEDDPPHPEPPPPAGRERASTRSGRLIPLGQLPPAVHETLVTGRPGIAVSAEVAPELREVLALIGAGAWAVARVQVAGEPFGVLAAASAEVDGFRRDDLRLLDGIARITGLAIGAALQHAELAGLERRLQRSVELALEAGRSLEPSRVVDSILVRVSEGVQADQATLARVDGEDLVIESTYRAGPGERLVPQRRHFPPELVDGVPELARALATGQPVVAGPFQARNGARELVAALPDAAHTLTVPFLVDGRAACLLTLGRGDGRPFDDADLAQLEPMADVALLALRNAHLHAQTERAERAASTRSGRLEQAIEAAADIGSGEELEDVVQRVLRRAVAVVGADRGNISRLASASPSDGDGRGGGHMILEYDHDPTDSRRQPGTRWHLLQSRLAGEAIRLRRSLIGALPDGPVAPDVAAWLERAGLRHVIQCPLLVEDEVVGLLGLSRRRDEPFTDADLQALRPFATLAALLLRNARMLEEARQVGQARSAFLHLAAHELRAPLTVIRGYLSLLEDGTYPVPDRTREEAVDTLVAKAQELESLVESLVTAARIEGGTMPRRPVRLDVGQAVRDAADRARPRARLEDARIEVRMPEGGAGGVASADRGHVARILDNLLNNALTYSPRPACVTLELRAADPIEVAVEDRGSGIPIDQHELVFERFHRVDGATSRGGAALGLGLSISRELARLNGGALVLERSAPGEGSVFVLQLPPAPPGPPTGGSGGA